MFLLVDPLTGRPAPAARAWQSGAAPPAWRTELLRGHLARLALRPRRHPARPGGGELRPAREVLEAVLDHARSALAQAGDLDLVTAGFDRLLGATGATRQRAAFERDGTIVGVVADLIARTEAVWRSS